MQEPKPPDSTFLHPATPGTASPGRGTTEICRNPPDVLTGTEKGIVLLIAVLAGFLTPFDGAAVNIALPTIGSEFHMDVISLSWIATAYLIAAALFLVPFGKIADIYGRKKVFLYGISIFAAASLAMTMVPSPNLMIVIRVIQGLGSGMIFGTTVAILSSVFPPGERGKALGIYITSVYFGLSLGPFLGGVLTQYFGLEEYLLCERPHRYRSCSSCHMEAERRLGRVPRRTLRPDRIRYLRDIHCCDHVRALRCYRRCRIRAPSYRDSGRDLLCPVRTEDLLPGPRCKTVHRKPDLCVLQLCRADQLQCNVCGHVPVKPLSPVHERLHPGNCRADPDSATGLPGHGFPGSRKTVGSY